LVATKRAPRRLLVGHVPIHAGHHQLHVVVGQDETTLHHSFPKRGRAKDVDPGPSRILLSQGTGGRLARVQHLFGGYPHTHARQLLHGFLRRAGRVVRRQDERDRLFSQECEELLQTRQRAIAPIENAVHVDDEMGDIR